MRLRLRTSRLLFRFGVALLALSCYAIVFSNTLLAHKLSPTGTALDRQVAKKYSAWFGRIVLWLTDRGMSHFTEPVHEEITQRIFGCQGEAAICANLDSLFASPYILAGVRWNDDPPFMLLSGQGGNTSCKITEAIRFTTQPKCWYELFKDAEKRAIAGEALDRSTKSSLLARTHFGDLQFLHAMASADGETAAETKQRIMMWAEFTWKVTRGDYGLETKLKDVNAPGFDRFFGQSEWRVQDLLALGNPQLRPWIKDVAFGSLLHTVEDSFAKGHVGRAGFGAACGATAGQDAPGSIMEFHSYRNQDPEKHGRYDSRNAFVEHWESARPNVVDAGRVLRQYRDRNPTPTWEEVKPYVDCIFSLDNPEAKASAGAGFEREK